MNEQDENIGYAIDWQVRAVSLNTTIQVTMKPKGGLSVGLHPETALEIEKILAEACAKIHSIAYRKLG
jgi:hypothetical protein